MSTTQIPLLAVTPKQHCFPISIYMTTSQRDDFIPDDSETTSCFLSPAYTCGIKYAQRPCRCLCPCDNKTSLFSLTCTLLTTMQVFFFPVMTPKKTCFLSPTFTRGLKCIYMTTLQVSLPVMTPKWHCFLSPAYRLRPHRCSSWSAITPKQHCFL